jgi:membrane protease YdiL (CAAX protease family)
MPAPRRNALLALLLTAPVPTLAVLVAVFVLPGAVGRGLWIAGKVVFYGLPVFWLLAVDRERLSLSPMRRGGLAFGWLTGMLIAILIVGVYRLLPDGWIEPDGLRDVAETNGFATPLAFLGISAWVVFVNALMEEYAYRWFIFTRCRALMPALPAVLLSAAIFVSHHVLLLAGYGISAPIVALASFGIFVGGVAWSWCYHRYGSIWPGYLSHAIVDVAVLAIGWTLLFES